MMISSEEYERLRAGYRRAFLAEEMPDEDLALLAKQRVPEEYAYLDDLIKDWKPGK